MNIQRKHAQQGVALVVSLIILVSLTMLGLTSIQRTTNDLAMAGNQRETGLMFQSAEVGLVTAEDFVEASNTNVDFDDTTLGLFAQCVRAAALHDRIPGRPLTKPARRHQRRWLWHITDG